MPQPQQAPKPITKFIRDLSGGVNISTSREGIEDNQAWWMEGMQPFEPGALLLVPQAGNGDPGARWFAATSGEAGVPTFMFTFNVAGVDYLFVVWSGSGNGYVGKADGSAAVTKIFAGTLTSGQTSAAQWNNKGILIVDPTGYWDWGVTTPNTLNGISNSVQQINIIDGGVYTTFPVFSSFSGGGGTGATGAIYQGIGSAIPLVAGSGYKVGDVLTFNFTFGPAPGDSSQPQLTVTTVNATGGVTGLAVTNPGQGINVGGACPASSVLTGGAGTAAQATLAWTVTRADVTNPGVGYTSAPTVNLSGGVASRVATFSVVVSGPLSGTSIATYAGRAWIAFQRTVTFTDAGSYNSFVGSGSSFTIEDDYLHDNITALFAANNYLYIFGSSSIDVLSNVTITSADTTNFSRVNISASIGCSQPQSIFSYYRSIVFFNYTGFYSLSGASPEKISDALDLLVPYITSAVVSGCQVSINGILCAAWSFQFLDIFMGGGAKTPLIAAYFKGKWFFATQTDAGTPDITGPMVSIPVDNALGAVPITTLAFGQQAYSPGSAVKLFSFFQLVQIQYWRLITKLYDGGKPMAEKQAIQFAMGVQMLGNSSTRSGIVVSVIDEKIAPGLIGQQSALPSGTFSGYKKFQSANAQGGGQFMGIEILGSLGSPYADIYRIEWLAFQYAELGEWLA